MQIFEHFDVMYDHRSGHTTIHVGTSDGDPKQWMQEGDLTRSNGTIYTVEAASSDTKDFWLEKLGHLVAEHAAPALDCESQKVVVKFMLTIKTGDFKGDPSTCYLADFPYGYKLFMVRSEPEGRDIRTDHYLRGMSII